MCVLSSVRLYVLSSVCVQRVRMLSSVRSYVLFIMCLSASDLNFGRLLTKISGAFLDCCSQFKISNPLMSGYYLLIICKPMSFIECHLLNITFMKSRSSGDSINVDFRAWQFIECKSIVIRVEKSSKRDHEIPLSKPWTLLQTHVINGLF